MGGEKMMSQRLLIPEVVSLSPGEFAIIIESMRVLEDMGIEVEPFGENTVIVKSVPAALHSC